MPFVIDDLCLFSVSKSNNSVRTSLTLYSCKLQPQQLPNLRGVYLVLVALCLVSSLYFVITVIDSKRLVLVV